MISETLTKERPARQSHPSPALLVVDDTMSIHELLTDLRGDELAAAVKATSPATSVLLITADVELDAEAGWASVDRCLIKPFPLRNLVAAVSTLLASNERVR